MIESTPAAAPTAYPYLAEQAGICRAQQCVKSAQAFEALSAQLLDRYGVERLVTSTNTRWRLILERFEWTRAQAVQCRDRVAELIAVCTISALAQALRRPRGEAQLIPDEAAGLAEEVRTTIESALAKVNDARSQEAAVVRVTVQNRVRFEARQMQERERREQLADAARLATARARAAGVEI